MSGLLKESNPWAPDLDISVDTVEGATIDVKPQSFVDSNEPTVVVTQQPANGMVTPGGDAPGVLIATLSQEGPDEARYTVEDTRGFVSAPAILRLEGVSQQPEPIAPPPESDLFLNPFSADSAHHRPIGTGAQYAGNNAATTSDWLKASSISINPGWQPFGIWMDKLPTTGPQYTIRHHGLASGINLPITLRLPASVQGTADNPGGQWDNVMTLYDPAIKMAYEFFKFDWNNGNPTAGFVRSYSFTGLGHPSQSNTARVGASASGFAMTTCALRGHQIETPGFRIGHSFVLSLPVRTGNNHMLGKGLIAPAFYRDTAVVQEREGFGEGSIPYGALLALLPSVNINALGLSEPGRRLAEAIRDYGMYVTDMIPNGSQPAMQADQYITQATRAQLVQNDIPKIYTHIRMVLNSEWFSGVAAVGGGTPLAPNTAFDA